MYRAKKVELCSLIVQYRCTKAVNINALKADLCSALWSVITAYDDFDNALSAFEKLFTDIWNAHTSVKTTRKRKKIVPWITQEVNECRRKRDVCYKAYLQNKIENIGQRYKRLPNACNTFARNAKCNFLTAILKNHQSRYGNISRRAWVHQLLRSAIFLVS